MNQDQAEVNTGSFRDRDGRVYHIHGKVYRGLSPAALDNFRRLQEEPFYCELVEAGKLIGTREVAAEDTGLPDTIQASWAGFLEHAQVPVISYPYEWTFSMLKTAAMLQLQLTEAAIKNEIGRAHV